MPLLQKNKKAQFVFLGRICKIKRIENLILACSVSKLFISSDYTLIIAGPSDIEFLGYEAMLHKMIIQHALTEKIKFIGEVESPQKEELLSESKVLFLVFQSENFGNVVIESLAQGTLVVATKGTPWQSLEENNCGYWVENTPKIIAGKIDELISMDIEKYKKMSENALVLSKNFTKDMVLLKWEKLLQ